MILFVLILPKILLVIWMDKFHNDIEGWCNDIMPLLENIRAIYNVKIIAISLNDNNMLRIMQILPGGDCVQLQ